MKNVMGFFIVLTLASCSNSQTYKDKAKINYVIDVLTKVENTNYKESVGNKSSSSPKIKRNKNRTVEEIISSPNLTFEEKEREIIELRNERREEFKPLAELYRQESQLTLDILERDTKGLYEQLLNYLVQRIQATAPFSDSAQQKVNNYLLTKFRLLALVISNEEKHAILEDKNILKEIREELREHLIQESRMIMAMLHRKEKIFLRGYIYDEKDTEEENKIYVKYRNSKDRLKALFDKNFDNQELREMKEKIIKYISRGQPLTSVQFFP